MISFPIDKEIHDQIDMARALAFVADSSACEPFLRWLNMSVIELDSRQRTEADEVIFRQRQGALMVLVDILNEIDIGEARFGSLKLPEMNRKPTDANFY